MSYRLDKISVIYKIVSSNWEVLFTSLNYANYQLLKLAQLPGVSIQKHVMEYVFDHFSHSTIFSFFDQFSSLINITIICPIQNISHHNMRAKTPSFFFPVSLFTFVEKIKPKSSITDILNFVHIALICLPVLFPFSWFSQFFLAKDHTLLKLSFLLSGINLCLSYAHICALFLSMSRFLHGMNHIFYFFFLFEVLRTGLDWFMCIQETNQTECNPFYFLCSMFF